MHTCTHVHAPALHRRQIHGHDFRCVAHVPTAAGGSGSGSEPGHLTYVSGAEEKVLRVFEAPQVRVCCVYGGVVNTSPNYTRTIGNGRSTGRGVGCKR